MWGTNPLTHETDSILMASLPINEGGDTLNFVLRQVVDSVDVIVRADEYSGYRVKQQIVKVPCLTMDTLTPADFGFKFTGDIVEDQTYMLGEKYLFDGDKKGFGRRDYLRDGDRYKYSTFVAGPNAFDERFIIDLKEEKIPAAVNWYAFSYFGGTYPYQVASQPIPSRIWSGYYMSRLPCEVYLYGTNENPETVALETCTRLFTLDYPENIDYFNESWAKYTDWLSNANWNIWDFGDGYLTESDEALNASDPVVLNMLCNYTGAKFRYLIFVVKDTFDSQRWNGWEENPYGYVTINELEVCVKAD